MTARDAPAAAARLQCALVADSNPFNERRLVLLRHLDRQGRESLPELEARGRPAIEHRPFEDRVPHALDDNAVICLTIVMTNDAVLDSVVSLVRAAASGELLSDVDSLSAGIEEAGWMRGVHGGQWSSKLAPTWSLFSGDHAPNLAVFLSDEDVDLVYACGQELARRLDREEGLRRHGLNAGWPNWEREDPRWANWSGLEADWVMWDGGPARLSLNVMPAYQPGNVPVAPSLHFQIERLDTPADGLPDDDERDRRIAHTGSPLARWHLAGRLQLPHDVVEALERDDDPSVVSAVQAYERFRRSDTARKVSHPGDEQA